MNPWNWEGGGGLEDREREGIGALGSAEQTLSVVSEFAIPDEDKADSPITAVIGEVQVWEREALVRFITRNEI